VGALTEVIAAAVTAGAGRTWKAIRRDPEAKALEGTIVPGLAGQLFALLHHDDPFIRGAAMEALAGRDRPEDLLLVASGAPTLPPQALADAYRAVEQLAAGVHIPRTRRAGPVAAGGMGIER
jgi:hypothetical protein